MRRSLSMEFRCLVEFRLAELTFASANPWKLSMPSIIGSRARLILLLLFTAFLSACASAPPALQNLQAETDDLAMTADWTMSLADKYGPENILVVFDIDNTLLGDDDALEQLKEIIHENRGHLGFGVASGRALELIEEALGSGIETSPCFEANGGPILVRSLAEIDDPCVFLNAR